jgi:hypothetical protein
MRTTMKTKRAKMRDEQNKSGAVVHVAVDADVG